VAARWVFLPLTRIGGALGLGDVLRHDNNDDWTAIMIRGCTTLGGGGTTWYDIAHLTAAVYLFNHAPHSTGTSAV